MEKKDFTFQNCFHGKLTCVVKKTIEKLLLLIIDNSLEVGNYREIIIDNSLESAALEKQGGGRIQ